MTPKERIARQKVVRQQYERESGDERARFLLEFQESQRRRRAIEERYRAAMNEIAQQYAAEMEAVRT